MNWHDPLYLGEEARKKEKKLIRKIEEKKSSFGVYVITLASNGTDLLDVLPASMLLASKDFKPEILGLAVTKDEAFELCEKIIMDVYRETNGFDVRSYFG